MTVGLDDKKLKFSVKDLVYILTIAAVFFSNYYTALYDRESIRKSVSDNAAIIEEHTQTFKDNNLELINYKLDEILKRLQ